MQLDIYFSHVWLFVLLRLALQNDPKKKKIHNPYRMPVTFSGAPPHVWYIALLCHSKLTLKYADFFFLSKHLPSPKSGFWTRLVTTMMRREDLITSNTSQTGRRRVVSSPLSKWKPVFSQWQIRLNSHTHSISSFPPQKHSLFIWTRIHKSYFAEGH